LKSKITKVAIGDIDTDETVFQWREQGSEDSAEGREQIKALASYLRNTRQPLAPILLT